jgi:hypothetical protein
MSDKKKDLAVPEKGGALAPVMDYGDLGGLGYENQSSDDISIPFLGIIQQLSPEIIEGDGKYIPGAKVGQLLNTVTQEVYDGDKGVCVVPVYSEQVYIEWVPRERGGGIAGRHAVDSAVVEHAKKNSSSFNELTTPEGNELIQTFYLYGLLLNSPDDEEANGPIVIAFTSTKIKIYKRIMTQLRSVKGRPPLFAHRIQITTKAEKNKAGQPYRNFDIRPALGTVAESMIQPDNPLLSTGLALHQAITGGKARAVSEDRDNQPDADVPF